MSVIVGDCVEIMAGMDACSVDAVVTDPPYGLGFMGKDWDSTAALASRPPSATTDTPLGRFNTGKGPAAVAFDGRAFQAWCEAWAREALRVLRPGAYMLAFGGTRTVHRLVCAIEDAGFEIRDMLSWNYGSGFPKSWNLGDGRGTALKPAWEGISLARKPLAGTVAANVLAHGTGALNVDGCRIGTSKDTPASASGGERPLYGDGWVGQPDDASGMNGNIGRWPANVCLDPEAAAVLDQQTGEVGGGIGVSTRGGGGGGAWNPTDRDSRKGQTIRGGGEPVGYCDSGGASRFFYVAKASSAERNAGLDGFEAAEGGAYANGSGMPGRTFRDGEWVQTGTWQEPNRRERRNVHPTVKPVDLMRWLVRLVTPPGGVVLDPFTGSGTTGIACVLEGFRFVGIEREAEYAEIARARIAWWERHPDGMALVDRLEREREQKTVRDAGQLDLFGSA